MSNLRVDIFVKVSTDFMNGKNFTFNKSHFTMANGRIEARRFVPDLKNSEGRLPSQSRYRTPSPPSSNRLFTATTPPAAKKTIKRTVNNAVEYAHDKKYDVVASLHD
jgi:hypothetical protein